MSQYKVGTANVINGSNTVTGVGTFWVANLVVGNLFSIQNENVWYTIQSITNDNQIILTSTYTGTTKSTVTYAIQRDFTTGQNYPIPSFGDSNASALIAGTLLQIDARLTSLSPNYALLNGNITLNGALIVSTGTGLPVALQGAMSYQGVWNASTNLPALASGVGTKGYEYRVSVAGSTTIDGLSQWNVGDFIIFNGATWDKIDGIANEVFSVAGRTGSVILTATDISDASTVGKALLTASSVAAQRVALNIDQATVVADTNQTATAAMETIAWISITAARTGILPSAATMSVGQAQFWQDESGNCSPTNTIIISRSGSDTINGGTSYTLNQPYSGVMFVRVSATKFTAFPLSQQLPTSTSLGGVKSATAAVGQNMTGIDTNGNPVFSTDTTGFRNRIINGDFRISLRGASGTVANAYSADRFIAGFSGTAPTWQVTTSATIPGSNLESILQITGIAGNTGSYFRHRIEAANSRDLAGQTCTLSYWVYQSTGSAMNVASQAFYANATDNFAATTSISTSAATTVPSATWTKITASFAIPAAATTGLEFVLVSNNPAIVTAQLLQVAQVQFEFGSYATMFERRPLSVELGMCQRYARQFGGNTLYEFFGSVSNYTTTNSMSFIALPTPMRVTPSVTFSAIGTFAVFLGGYAQTITSISTNAVSSAALGINIVGSGFTVGLSGFLQANNSLSASIFLNSEL